MSRHLLLFTLVPALLGIPLAAAGDNWVYHCTDDAGRVLFSDRPCDGAAQKPVRQPAAPRVGTRQPEMQLPGAPVSGRPAPPRNTALRTAADPELRCAGLGRRLEQVNAQLRRGYAPAEGERLRARRRDLEDRLRGECR